MGVTINWEDWNSGSVQEGGTRVYRSTSTFDEGSLPATLATLGPDVTTYDDTSATNVDLYYMLEAFKADHPSRFTDVLFLPQAVFTAPTSFAGTRISDTRIDLSWVDNNSGPVQEDATVVYRSTSSFDSGTLPAPLTTLTADVEEYSDLAASTAETHYMLEVQKTGESSVFSPLFTVAASATGPKTLARRGVSSTVLDDSTTGNTVALPVTANADDLILVYTGTDQALTGTPVASAGYSTLVDGYTTVGLGFGIDYSFAAGGETSLSMDGSTAGRKTTVIVEVWEGVDPTEPFDAVTPAVSTGSTPTAITTNTDDAVSILAGFLDDDDVAGSVAAYPSWTGGYGADTGQASTTDGCTLGTCYKVLGTAGSVPISSGSWSWTTSDNRRSVHFALRQEV